MTAITNGPVKLEILSDPSHLPVVRAALEKMCQKIGFAEKEIGEIILSVDEALTNVIRHAYANAHDKPIEIELTPQGRPQPQRLVVVVRDFGMHVDPSQIKSRDLDDVRPGGLGVHIIRECMDKVEYRAADGGGTILTLEKELHPRQEDART